jgi:hypothetical protein
MAHHGRMPSSTTAHLTSTGTIISRRKFVVIVDKLKSGARNFYIAPPADLEVLVRERALEFAKRLKRDNTPRSIKFRKELPRDVLARWHNAWHLLGEAPQSQPEAIKSSEAPI